MQSPFFSAIWTQHIQFLKPSEGFGILFVLMGPTVAGGILV